MTKTPNFGDVYDRTPRMNMEISEYLIEGGELHQPFSQHEATSIRQE